MNDGNKSTFKSIFNLPKILDFACLLDSVGNVLGLYFASIGMTFIFFLEDLNYNNTP